MLSYEIITMAGQILISKRFLIMSLFIPFVLMSVFLTCGESCATMNNFAKWNKVH